MTLCGIHGTPGHEKLDLSGCGLKQVLIAGLEGMAHEADWEAVQCGYCVKQRREAVVMMQCRYAMT